MVITEEQVIGALMDVGTWNGESERWHLPGSDWNDPGYTETTARAIVKACLVLGRPVSATLTGEAWCAVAERLEAIEDRLDRYGVPQ